MIMKIVSGTACVLLALAASGPVQAYQCKSHAISAVGVKHTKLQARATSLANWTARTKGRYGLAWSVYDIAQNKQVSCRRTSIAGKRRWNCERVAKPCLYVVP